MPELEGLIPINDCLLVELVDDLEFVATPDKQFSTKTKGYVKAIPTSRLDKNYANYARLLHKFVYFEDYKDGTQLEENGKKYAFIKYEDIRGYRE